MTILASQNIPARLLFGIGIGGRRNESREDLFATKQSLLLVLHAHELAIYVLFNFHVIYQICFSSAILLSRLSEHSSRA